MDTYMYTDIDLDSGSGSILEQLLSVCGQFGDRIDLFIFIIAAYAHYGYGYDALDDLSYILHYMFASTVYILSICRAMWYCRITTWPAFVIVLSISLIAIFYAGVRFIRLSLLSCMIHLPEIMVIKLNNSTGTYALVNGNEVLGTIFSSIMDKLTESCDIATVEDYDDVCAICLDNMESKEGIYRVRACGHHYHGLCILRSMQSTDHICVKCRDEAAPPKNYNIPSSIRPVNL